MSEEKYRGLFDRIERNNTVAVATLSIQHEFSERKTVHIEDALSAISFGLLNTVDYNSSFEEYISEKQFNNWCGRGVFLNLEIMKRTCRINKITENSTKEDCLLYLEYVYNMLPLIKNNPNLRYMKNSYDALIKTIEKIISDHNYEFKEIDGLYYLILSDEILDNVLDSAEDVVKDNAVRFRSVRNKGNLENKKQILCSLATNIESLKHTMDNKKYGHLRSDTTFLLNKINIRHSENQIQLPKDQIEEWYDRTFDLCMLSLHSIKHIDIMDEIESMKSDLNIKGSKQKE